jgi:hypothetical protein
MTNKELMERCTKRAFGYKAKAVFDKIEDIVFKEKIENDGSYFLVVNKSGEAMQSVMSDGLLRMTASQILLKDMEIYTREYKIVWMVKKPKPTYLDKVEENYLRNIIAPLAKSGCSNFSVEKENNKSWKCYSIRIWMKNPKYSKTFLESICLPMYDKSLNMYRGLDTDKKYSIDYLVE